MAAEIWRTKCRHCEAVIRVTDVTPSRDEPGGATSYVVRCPACDEKDTHWRGSGTGRRAVATVINEEPKASREDANHSSRTAHDVGRDALAWTLAALPLVVSIAEIYLGNRALFLSFALNTAFAAADYYQLRSRGCPTPHRAWAVFFIPVYLWQRSTLLRQPKHYFLAWIAAFAVSIVVTFAFDHSDIEDAARPVVTRIVQEQLGGGKARCVRLKVTEDVGGGYYKAVATMSDGSDLRVMIEDRGDSIFVTVRQ